MVTAGAWTVLGDWVAAGRAAVLRDAIGVEMSGTRAAGSTRHSVSAGDCPK